MSTNDNSISRYQHAVSVIKAAILKSQARAAQAITHKQLALYYGIGRYVRRIHERDSGVQVPLIP